MAPPVLVALERAFDKNPRLANGRGFFINHVGPSQANDIIKQV
jgi:hypothetical protein